MKQRLRCTPSLMQISLPEWPARLPLGLTQLVVSPLGFWDAEFRDTSCMTFVSMYLPQLRNLRHLAFHSLQEIGDTHLLELCNAIAGAVPQLISLHLVRMPLFVPSLCSL